MTACEVWPGIYVGDLTAAHFFQGPKLCVRDQPGDYLYKSRDDLQIHFVYGKASASILDNAIKWLDHVTAKGLPVLVHCSGGLHRSAAVVANWIRKRHGMTIDRAYSLMREMRPEIEPRPHWLSPDEDAGAWEP